MLLEGLQSVLLPLLHHFGLFQGVWSLDGISSHTVPVCLNNNRPRLFVFEPDVVLQCHLLLVVGWQQREARRLSIQPNQWRSVRWSPSWFQFLFGRLPFALFGFLGGPWPIWLLWDLREWPLGFLDWLLARWLSFLWTCDRHYVAEPVGVRTKELPVGLVFNNVNWGSDPAEVLNLVNWFRLIVGVTVVFEELNIVILTLSRIVAAWPDWAQSISSVPDIIRYVVTLIFDSLVPSIPWFLSSLIVLHVKWAPWTVISHHHWMHQILALSWTQIWIMINAPPKSIAGVCDVWAWDRTRFLVEVIFRNDVGLTAADRIQWGVVVEHIWAVVHHFPVVRSKVLLRLRPFSAVWFLSSRFALALFLVLAKFLSCVLLCHRLVLQIGFELLEHEWLTLLLGPRFSDFSGLHPGNQIGALHFLGTFPGVIRWLGIDHMFAYWPLLWEICGVTRQRRVGEELRKSLKISHASGWSQETSIQRRRLGLLLEFAAYSGPLSPIPVDLRDVDGDYLVLPRVYVAGPKGLFAITEFKKALLLRSLSFWRAKRAVSALLDLVSRVVDVRLVPKFAVLVWSDVHLMDGLAWVVQGHLIRNALIVVVEKHRVVDHLRSVHCVLLGVALAAHNHVGERLRVFHVASLEPRDAGTKHALVRTHLWNIQDSVGFLVEVILWIQRLWIIHRRLLVGSIQHLLVFLDDFLEFVACLDHFGFLDLLDRGPGVRSAATIGWLGSSFHNWFQHK